MSIGDTRLWELYHENSKLDIYSDHVPDDIVLEFMKRTEGGIRIDSTNAQRLPRTERLSSKTLAQCLARRRSAVPTQKPQPMTIHELAQILEMSTSVTCDNRSAGYPRPFRAYPSGGALYPVDILFLARAVDGLEQAIYVLDPVSQQICVWPQLEDAPDHILNAIVHRDIAEKLSVLVVLLGSFERSTFKYGERGYRMTLLEAGHISQNLILSSVDVGRNAMPVAGFVDREIEKVLCVDGVVQSIVITVAIF